MKGEKCQQRRQHPDSGQAGTITWDQVMLWDEQLNQEMAKAMLAEGVLVIPLRFFTNEDGWNRFYIKGTLFHPAWLYDYKVRPL